MHTEIWYTLGSFGKEADERNAWLATIGGNDGSSELVRPRIFLDCSNISRQFATKYGYD